MTNLAKNDAILTLTIKSSRGTLKKDFPKTDKISDVIEAARVEFKLAAGDRYDLVLADKPTEILEHQRTLVSYHLTDGAILTLTWTGSGV
jgi:hypothetical protein